jgi:hydrogenase nickel incorporation protein HypB
MAEIKVLRNILEANQRAAEDNRERLRKHGIFCVNLIASPGAGKTSILEKTIAGLCYTFRFACIEGDITGEHDARRIASLRIPVVQVNTEGGCHLSAAQVGKALDEFQLDKTDVLLIENVGNLVCPAEFDLGEHMKAVVLSAPEGDDKPAKYPVIFSEAGAVLVNKADLLDIVDFRLDRAVADIRKVNPEAPIFELSAKTGQGFIEWFNWFKKKAFEARGQGHGSSR